MARYTLASACLSMAAIAMSITASGVALTQLQVGLGAGITQLLWVQNGFILSFAALLLPFGSLADRIGQRSLFMLGAAVFTLATLVSVTASSFIVLMAGRLLQGCGAALLAATGPPALTAVFTDEADRQRAFGYLGASGGIGLTLGAFIAGAVVSWGGWRAAFAIHSPFVIIALVVAWRGFVGKEGAGAGAFDWLGMVLSCIFISCAMAFGITGAEQGWTTAPVLTLFAITLGTGTAFVAVEIWHTAPLVHLPALGNSQFLLACAVCLLFTTVWVALFIYVPLNLQTAQARSALDAGTTMLGLMLPALIMPMIASRLILHVHIGTVLTAGFVSMVIGLLALFCAWSGDTQHALELVGLVMCGTGAGLLYGLVDYLALTALPPQQSGIASGAFNLVRLMGDALGAIVPGAILLQNVKAAFAHADLEVSRALMNEVAAGHFAAVERVYTDPTLANSLTQLAASSFSIGMGYAILALCGLSVIGAVLTLRSRRSIVTRVLRTSCHCSP